MDNVEYRLFGQSFVVDERSDDKRPIIKGHAAVFNSLSLDLGGFQERIKPGAFARALKEKQDVYALRDHDSSKIIGRTANDSLVLREDEAGLLSEITPPDTPLANETVTLLRGGYLDKMSFGFIARKINWIERKGMVPIRELEDVDLFDVSVVTHPAYPATSVQARSMMWPAGLPTDVREKIHDPKDVEITRLTVRLSELEKSLSKAEAELAGKVAEFTTMKIAAESANRELTAERTEREQSDRRSQEALSQAQQHIDSARTAIGTQRTRVYRNILAAERAKQLVT